MKYTEILFKKPDALKWDLKEVQMFVKLFACYETQNSICRLKLLNKGRATNVVGK